MPGHEPSSYLFTDDYQILEELYETFLQGPDAVDSSWKKIFENLATPESFKTFSGSDEKGERRVYNLIQAYRTYGYLQASVNPIATQPPSEADQLKLSALGFEKQELSQLFPTCGLLPASIATLQEIIQALQQIYCGRIGFEYMGVGADVEEWLQQQLEPNGCRIALSFAEKKMILHNLSRSELFEAFLHTKFVGQKRFSLEGGETLIPMLEEALEKGSKLGAEEFIIGMPHRGRLNVLVNILRKGYRQIFSEFEAHLSLDSNEGSGDVKYHKGYSAVVTLPCGKKVFLELTANPSHLESVDPVVEGQARARQEEKRDDKREKVIPILIHGDASIAGQGVVYETLQLYKLEGYSTGGTIHIVNNNQIGFTTLPKDARSTRDCTDIARSFGAPVFHVNAEDPESAVFAIDLAIQLRQRFHIDVFINLNAYRKYGHNESDEPAFTQPLEYQLIRKKKSVREIYRDQLIQQGVLEKELGESLEAEFKTGLQSELEGSQKEGSKAAAMSLPPIKIEEQQEVPQELFHPSNTAISLELLKETAQKLSQIPEGFHLHSKIEALIQQRLQMVTDSPDVKRIDWGMAETLAYATLLWEGKHIRLSGQDSRRGTFSHRHAMWVDQSSNQKYVPLKHLKEGQGSFDIFDSSLSEYAVLGFEYGYSLSYPEALVIWEAQFGDFSNGAQIIIDQYITTSEQKWGRSSGLTLFLPHGYEGQGPEHSSARIERFLQLAGDANIQVVSPTTPAQFFHLLRRQAFRQASKPLIVLTPKRLLRAPECISSPKELAEGTFQEILEDPSFSEKAERLLFCNGAIYYALAAEREKRGKLKEIAIVRFEQLYPLHINQIEKVLKRYPEVKQCFWVQDEPSNMGAWDFIRPFLQKLLPNLPLQYAGRKRSASPAVGSHKVHEREHEAIMQAVFKE